MKNLYLYLSLAVCGSTLVGCKPERVVTFEPNWVYAKTLEIETTYPMAEALKETELATTEFFGTPDHPKLPKFAAEEDDYKELLSMDKLQKSAGKPIDAGVGLYRTHCATCHGVTGNGRGETAALLPVYPRDYRMGTFKFKSTSRGAKPTKEDIASVIKHGIPGTSMVVIPALTDDDIDALVDYVIYLSWRGEFERQMLYAGSELEFEEGDHLYAPESSEFKEQAEAANDLAMEIADEWLEAEDSIVEVPEPEDIEVPATIEEVVNAANEPGDSELKESIAKGKALFVSETAACSKCHGALGYGDGQTNDYDDWTKDWTKRIGIDPLNETEQISLIARGALPPLTIKPRDFREGLYRGGSDPETLYRRITVGIEGSPMPAAILKPEEVWHLVNYVRSLAVLPGNKEESQPEVTPQAETPTATSNESQANAFESAVGSNKS